MKRRFLYRGHGFLGLRTDIAKLSRKIFRQLIDLTDRAARVSRNQIDVLADIAEKATRIAKRAFRHAGQLADRFSQVRNQKTRLGRGFVQLGYRVGAVGQERFYVVGPRGEGSGDRVHIRHRF